jgi:hypothetical protein
MRPRYKILVQSSEEAEFMYSRALSLLCCDIYVKIYRIFLAAITSTEKGHLWQRCSRLGDILYARSFRAVKQGFCKITF